MACKSIIDRVYGEFNVVVERFPVDERWEGSTWRASNVMMARNLAKDMHRARKIRIKIGWRLQRLNRLLDDSAISLIVMHFG